MLLGSIKRGHGEKHWHSFSLPFPSFPFHKKPTGIPKTNFRRLASPIDLLVSDVSFIGYQVTISGEIGNRIFYPLLAHQDGPSKDFDGGKGGRGFPVFRVQRGFPVELEIES